MTRLAEWKAAEDLVLGRALPVGLRLGFDTPHTRTIETKSAGA